MGTRPCRRSEEEGVTIRVMIAVLDPAEVEQRLERLIAKHKAKGISVAEVKRRIYETGGDDVMAASNRFLKWWTGCFRRSGKEDIEKLLQIFQDAWNAFPHQSLAGKSPQQVVQEEMEKHPELARNSIDEHEMPKVIVGGVEMEWKEHQAMLRRMEKLQKPFKHWTEERALPAYRKFLQTKYKTKRSIEKHYDVADHFLHRSLHVGFLDFEEIRPAFAVWEFPAWWPDHILYSNLTEDKVWSSLCDFLWFAEFVLRRSIPGVWKEADGDHSCDDVTCPYCGSKDTVPLKAGLPDEVRSTKVGRNDPCPCGSGKKFKKCCGH